MTINCLVQTFIKTASPHYFKAYSYFFIKDFWHCFNVDGCTLSDYFQFSRLNFLIINYKKITIKTVGSFSIIMGSSIICLSQFPFSFLHTSLSLQFVIDVLHTQ